MMSKYATSSTMYIDKFTEKVIQPDENLIKTLHAYLDMVAITNENLAMAIDMIIADLLRFHAPNRRSILTPPELLKQPKPKERE